MAPCLTDQSSSVFSSTLYYTDPSRTATTGKYDGSVSEWSWSRGSGTTAQTYAFSYDVLGRLTETKRYTGSSTTATNAFTEKGLAYDRNGNITALTRYGTSASSAEDNFAFTLTGNRISSLTNSGTNGSGATYTAFTYDANGNTTHDGRTGHDLSWNMLNLISGVSATSGGSTTQLASYTWFADGSKYSALRADGSGYVYKGDLVYERSAGGTLSLDCVLTTGGRIVANKNSSGTITGYTVYHHITDHLGSVRAITDASTGNVVETSDFLPFGTRWSQTAGSSSSTLTDASNRWRYSGKEEQKAINSSLPLIDYGARMYDPTIARWMSMDPMAEKYYSESLYIFNADNPINIIDPNGNERSVVVNSKNRTITVKATYYYSKFSTNTANAINQAIKIYNKTLKNLPVEYNGELYSVSFELKSVPVVNRISESEYYNESSPGNIVIADQKEVVKDMNGNSILAWTDRRDNRKIHTNEKNIDVLTALHEIGHTLGASDKPDQKDIMYEKYNIKTPVTLSHDSLTEIISIMCVH